MRYFLVLFLFIITPPSIAQAGNECKGKTGCERKECEIKRQMDYALRHDNDKKYDRLVKDLKNVQQYCTDD